MPRNTDITQLSERSLYLFKMLVERFIEDGQPVGSRTLARDALLDLSPATIRNVMADLEDLGLLHSPHTSAGRIPTVKGYRLFVDSLLAADLPAGQTEFTLPVAPSQHTWTVEAYNSIGISPPAPPTYFWLPFQLILSVVYR